MGKFQSKEDFVQSAIIKHGNLYDYSEVVYVRSKAKVNIICATHGIFAQSPNLHLRGRGCPSCKLVDIDKFIFRSKQLHGNRYDYSKVVISNVNDKVIIICPKHGKFIQRARDHIARNGCPLCKSSIGENRIREYLIDNSIVFEEQKKFVGCKYKDTLRFDFYVPSKNICIEFDGIQHFIPYSFSSDQTDATKLRNLEDTQARDNIKVQYCLENRISLIRISYKEINSINEILSERSILDGI